MQLQIKNFKFKLQCPEIYHFICDMQRSESVNNMGCIVEVCKFLRASSLKQNSSLDWRRGSVQCPSKSVLVHDWYYKFLKDDWKFAMKKNLRIWSWKCWKSISVHFRDAVRISIPAGQPLHCVCNIVGIIRPLVWIGLTDFLSFG